MKKDVVNAETVVQINVDNMPEWSLVKKIKSLNLTEKVFETDDFEKSEKHEAQIPRFTKELEDKGIEIFAVKGHQFVTEEGVYSIAHKSDIQYGE